MVVGDNTPVWSDLGQTQSVRHRLPGRRQSACGSDVYGDSCPPEELFGLGMGVPGHENSYRYASDNSSEMFGMGEDAVFGQVMFPNIKRADYAVNPLSGFGQVLFPNIKRADYAVNPLSGFGTVRIPDTDSLGTVRVPDSSDAFSGMGTVRIPDMDSFGFLGQEAPATNPPGATAGAKQFIGNWGLAPWLAAAALLGGAYFAKGNLKTILSGMGVVAGGMGAVQLVGKLTK
jgi:hypothetical protein